MKMISFLPLLKFLGQVETELDEKDVLDKLVREWDTWDVNRKPPTGWTWVRDRNRPGGVLVRVCDGVVSVVKCRQWHRYKNSPSLKRKLSREQRGSKDALN